VIETYRKQFRNIISIGNATVDGATELFKGIKQDQTRIGEIEKYVFSPFSEHPAPHKLEARAEILISAYRRIFPTRSLSQEFTHNELLQLIDAASEALAET
jgi:hypothetical protein